MQPFLTQRARLHNLSKRIDLSKYVKVIRVSLDQLEAPYAKDITSLECRLHTITKEEVSSDDVAECTCCDIQTPRQDLDFKNSQTAVKLLAEAFSSFPALRRIDIGDLYNYKGVCNVPSGVQKFSEPKSLMMAPSKQRGEFQLRLLIQSLTKQADQFRLRELCISPSPGPDELPGMVGSRMYTAAFRLCQKDQIKSMLAFRHVVKLTWQLPDVTTFWRDGPTPDWVATTLQWDCRGFLSAFPSLEHLSLTESAGDPHDMDSRHTQLKIGQMLDMIMIVDKLHTLSCSYMRLEPRKFFQFVHRHENLRHLELNRTETGEMELDEFRLHLSECENIKTVKMEGDWEYKDNYLYLPGIEGTDWEAQLVEAMKDEDDKRAARDEILE